MKKPTSKPNLAVHSQDFYAWTQEQGQLLKGRSRAALDWENLAVEISSLGRSERREVRNHLAVVLQHLLMWEFQPSKRRPGWSASILEARTEIKRLVEESPSLRSYPATVMAQGYEMARLRAADETGLPPPNFPLQCPYAIADILDGDFFPGPR